jgi:hypothetical protein
LLGGACNVNVLYSISSGTTRSSLTRSFTCRAITSCADLSRALLLLLQPCAARPGAKPADTAAALQDAAAAFVAAAASWDDARRELLKARAAALEQYWGVVVSATHVRVARHGQVGAVSHNRKCDDGLCAKLYAVQDMLRVLCDLCASQTTCLGVARHGQVGGGRAGRMCADSR